ncbi:laccase domain protein yfiH [Candidatus Photodesmus blepharus]|uniref:Purine nucleoside phosphorylase n=1 Tax=Candidatus Photodesmus blepharonis TaxID=1179155 RepID=A0A084CNU5_9GAMM|nr:peptidoglycan editing factor PgeF [Candidatus Photodesmus blepharus]KEY91474.1 laccase domain protein yfiH [Candidatus Photodesmus blepharus]
MSFIIPHWQAPKNIKAISSTRIGGFSHDLYAGLNISTHVGDDLIAVNKNRKWLVEAANMPSVPVWLKQTHSVHVEEIFYPVNYIVESDGAFTKCVNTVCSILTADCLPILLTNIQGTQVAALHAGWRGLARGIVENGVNKFDGEIIAWLGPAIGHSVFEVGECVVQEFLNSSLDVYKAFKYRKCTNKWLVDITLLAKKLLNQAGVVKITSSGLCTYSNKIFYSYRRDGITGRQGSFIWIED